MYCLKSLKLELLLFVNHEKILIIKGFFNIIKYNCQVIHIKLFYFIKYNI